MLLSRPSLRYPCGGQIIQISHWPELMRSLPPFYLIRTMIPAEAPIRYRAPSLSDRHGDCRRLHLSRRTGRHSTRSKAELQTFGITDSLRSAKEIRQAPQRAQPRAMDHIAEDSIEVGRPSSEEYEDQPRVKRSRTSLACVRYGTIPLYSPLRSSRVVQLTPQQVPGEKTEVRRGPGHLFDVQATRAALPVQSTPRAETRPEEGLHHRSRRQGCRAGELPVQAEGIR